MRLPKSLALGPVVLLLAAACSKGTPAVGGLSPLFADSVTITVVNLNYYDAGIYAQYEGGISDRLGTVTGNTSQTFSIRYHPRLLIMRMHLIGVGTALSNELIVDPGDVLELRLMPDLHRKVVRGRG